MTTLEAALDLWRRGLSIIPVPRPRAGVADGKIPTIKWKEYQERRATEDEIRAWFGNAPMNIAIITGAISGVVAIDADSRAAVDWIVEHLPRTPWQTLTARGFHMFYRCPDTRVGNRARVETRDGKLAIDVRGDGGYVIAPGSVHASGRTYEMAGDWSVPRDRLPVFWPGWIVRPKRHPLRRDAPRPSGDIVDRARRYLSAIPRPEIGSGSDDAMYWAARRLTRGFELPDADATSLLWEWAGGRDGWTIDWVAGKVRNARQYGTEPVGSLR